MEDFPIGLKILGIIIIPIFVISMVFALIHAIDDAKYQDAKLASTKETMKINEKIISTINDNWLKMSFEQCNAIKSLYVYNKDIIRQKKYLNSLVITCALILDNKEISTDMVQYREMIDIIINTFSQKELTECFLNILNKKEYRRNILMLAGDIKSKELIENICFHFYNCQDKEFAKDLMRSESESLFEVGRWWAFKQGIIWELTREVDNIFGYEKYIINNPGNIHVLEARKRLKHLYELPFNKKEIDMLLEMQKHNSLFIMRNVILTRLVVSAAKLINDNGDWTDYKTGPILYDILRYSKRDLLTEAIGRVVVSNINRLHVLFLFVKLGIPGSQQYLNNLLIAYGDIMMAEDYLNSGSKDLYDGAVSWANDKGYKIKTGPGSQRVKWGSF